MSVQGHSWRCCREDPSGADRAASAGAPSAGGRGLPRGVKTVLSGPAGPVIVCGRRRGAVIAASHAGIAGLNIQVPLLGPDVGGQDEMAAVVPPNDYGLFPLISEDADRGGSEREQPS